MRRIPAITTDPYSFSKQIMEEIGAYFWRREGLSSVFLRLPGVYEVTEENEERCRAGARGRCRPTRSCWLRPEE
jgi:nucleoside-diphosphate-sugar epimerase